MSELHLSVDAAKWEVPLPLLLLMARENQRQTDRNVMNLQDKEAIDKLLERQKENGN